MTVRLGMIKMPYLSERNADMNEPNTLKPSEFETTLTRLEQLVERMEHEALSLEESIAIFEEGMQLSTHCQQMLAAAKQRVESILQNGQAATPGRADRGLDDGR
jgi:exodeoxyribonuclease VII small subunit